MESGKSSQAIRKGLIFMTPLVIISSLARVGLSFPVNGYQEWLNSADAFSFLQILTRIYSSTTDYFSLILSFSVAWCYAEQLKIKNGKSFVSFGATASFMLLIGMGSRTFDPQYFGTAGISSALLAALITTKLFHLFVQYPVFKIKNEDTDSFLSKMATSIFPLGCILILFGLFSFLMDYFFQACLQDLIERFLTVIFMQLRGNKLFMGLFYTVSLHALWFFGIHGSHVYYEINEVFLNNLLHRNIVDIAVGNIPTEIVNTVSLNTFCNLGGAGSTIALVIAILLVSKNRNIRRVAKFAAVPSVFNVNEILLFGLPIVFNPLFLIPFLFIPFLNLCIGYTATIAGFVPVISRDINWTTPPLFSGYIATESFAGVLLQIVLIAVDVAIYIPFVKKMDKKSFVFENLYEDDFEKIKTMEEKDNENRRLIRALANMYDDVYEANLESRIVRVIRTTQSESILFSGQELTFSEFEGWFFKKVSKEYENELRGLFSSADFLQKLAGSGVLEKEIRLDVKGRMEWFRLQFIVSRIKEDKPSMITVMAMNIDEFKRRQEEQNIALRSAYEAARQASIAKSTFLSNMSHDIRTPMNAILGMCMIARQNMDNPKKVEDCLSKIDASSAHLLNLINAVLDMSKIESGKVVFHESTFDISQMVKEICDIIQPQAAKKGVEFCYGFESLKNIYVTGDSLRIRQIFVNILGNAVKFTPEKGKIKFSARTCPSSYTDYTTFEFICSDTGMGMSEEFKEKLFQPFERETNSKIHSIGGNGLGMAITKNIIDLMNGEIYVDSSIGVGTTFTVVLHLKEADRNGLQEKEGEEENRGTSRNFEGKRILLVEDNELNREIAREFLTLAGVTIEEAQNGKEAVEMVEKSGENYYDLIFMDIQMPLMNGYEAAKAIRALHRRDADLPIIAMTANAFSDDIRMAKEAGMNEHISKPIDIKKLFKAMEEFL